MTLASLLTLLVGLPTAHAQQSDGGEIDAAPPGWEQQGSGNNYVLLDSHDIGGPIFDVPAHTPGTNSGLTQGNETALIPIGFSFSFYDTTYTNVYITTHGYLSFDNEVSSSPQSGPLQTNTTVTVPSIFGHWAYLYLPTCGAIYYDTYGAMPNRVLVVEWRSVCSIFSPTDNNPMTFQIKLFETSHAIEFHYFDLNMSDSAIDYGNRALVGLRNGAVGSEYLQYSWFQPALEDNFAIRLWRPSCDGVIPTTVGTRADDDLSTTGGVVYGHTGDDVITGSVLADRLCGAEGDDILRGFASADQLFGGPGNDVLRGGPGSDSLFGGPGNDTMFGGGGADGLEGEAGADVINGQGGMDIIRGGPGHDVINGQGAADTISGGDGVLTPGSGNDIINGQAGADSIGGEDGHDTIKGQTGPDRLFGDPGNDELFGGEGNDELYGGAGNDKCAGNAGPNDQAEAATCETTPGVESLF